MALIKDRRLAPDRWQLLDSVEVGEDGALPPLPEGDVIVPLAAWLRARARLLERRSGVGVWLAGDDDPADIAQDFVHLAVIAVRFPKFVDGRGYSVGRLLRERHGWRGELRAIGDVQRDQLLYLARCGFDAFALRDGEDVDTALAAFDDFSESYQAAVDQTVPLFRRRTAATVSTE
jgi:uncharacterized protein (DUF934 family)